MRLGAALPLGDLGGGPLRADSMRESAAAIEALGYDSIWTFDAIGRGFLLPDPLMALLVAAGVTERVELGTGVMQLPIRNVADVAHRLFTLETNAPGRVLFGVGPGSTEHDFVAFGGDYGDRFSRFDEQWSELQRWVADGTVDDRDLCIPAALLGGPTLMLAGWRGRWVERAAAESDGWIASAHYADDAQLADGLARFRDGGGNRAVATNVQAGAELGPTIDRINHLGEIGFDDVVVLDLTPSLERLTRIREGVQR